MPSADEVVSEPVPPAKQVNPDSLWGAPLSPSAIAALDPKEQDSSQTEENHMDVDAFDAIHDSVLEGAGQSADAFGGAPTVGQAAGETPPLEKRLDGAIRRSAGRHLGLRKRLLPYRRRMIVQIPGSRKNIAIRLFLC